MFLFILFLIIIIFFIFSDLVPLYKKKLWKIFWIYSALMSFALLLNLFILMDFKLPIISESIKGFLDNFITFEDYDI